LQYWGLNAGPHILPLEPRLQPFFAFSYFLDRVTCFCPNPAPNCNLLFL
jgi:hypothetical protein